MGTEPRDDARRAVEARLATLGVSIPVREGSAELALDATLTPETFACSEGLGPVTAVPPASVGPLPRIALSGAALETPKASDAVPSAADLEILSLLGEGGMGRVHLARQRSLGRDVAVKTLKAEIADTRTVAMLRAEATTMGRLEHPNVVPVHAVGLDDGGRLVLVMKRIDGISWRELLRDPSHPRWERLAPSIEDHLDVHLDVLAQVARALQFAHEQEIVHRDVKPENVLLGAHGEVYLADWGVALRKTDAASGTELVGTPAYMAPEMVVGDRDKIDARTDVFLLGATLHEVLTGSPPHDGRTLHETLLTALESQLPTYGADVPEELAAIARRAMAPRAEDRFGTAGDFRLAILETRRHRGSIALARSGKAILAALGPQLANEGVGATDASIDRRLTECRFALVSALRDWPENREARVTLDACLRVMIDHELARENAGAAEGLLAELPVPDPALAARIRALGTQLEARRKEADRLHQLVADQDLGVGFWARIVSMSLLILVALGITALVWSRGGEDAPFTPREPVLFGIGILATVVVPIVIFRKNLLANAIGRRTSVLLVLGCLTMLLHRLVGMVFDIVPSGTLAGDLVMLAGFTASAGVLVPRVAWAALFPLVAAGVACALPEHVGLIFSAGSIANIVAIGALWSVEVRTKRKAALRSPDASGAPRP